jgi:hypothetical protein
VSSPIDRSVRYLNALGGASTSRVLNLMSIARGHADDPDHKAKPLFASPVFNRAMILRHRVRADETYLFHSRRTVATKIIVPFDERDLKLGGRSFFVDQRGYHETMREVGNYRDDSSVDRDLEILRLVDGLPSLDPFLLREHLRMNQFAVGDAYFQIAVADRKRMYDFVSKNIQALIALATGASGANAYSSSTSKLVSALLSTEVDEKLEPLRLTLGLAGEDFREGVFSWRGFLYYKWSMTDFWPQVGHVLRELKNINPNNIQTAEMGAYIPNAKKVIIENVKKAGHDVGTSLKTYDAAYDQLVANSNPRAFRDFLLSAPRMFLDLGEKIGAISHIVSFWRYRFPKNQPVRIDAEEVAAIFQDFESSLGVAPPMSFAAAS